MKSIVISLLILLPFITFAQEFPNLKSNNTATLIAYFSKGDTRTYHVVNTDQVFKNDKEKPSEETTNEFDMTFKVLDSTEKSYTIELVYTHIVSDKKLDPNLQELQKFSENVRILFKTDEFGSFDTILNVDELISTMNASLDMMVSKIKEKVTKSDKKIEFDLFVDAMRKTVSNRENIDALVASDILMLFGMYGIELTLNKPIEIDIEFPTINDITLMGKATLLLKEINKQKEEFKFTCTQKPNKEELKKYVIRILESIAGQKLDKPDFDEFNYNSKVNANYTTDLWDGWMKKVSSNSVANYTLKGKKIRKVSRQEFKLKQ